MFAALDFETADHGPDSACAVGVVRVERSEGVASATLHIRPPRPRVLFTHIHGLTWAMVEDAPPFAEAWPLLAPFLDGASVLAAHNAPFDRRVARRLLHGGRAGRAGGPVPLLGATRPADLEAEAERLAERLPTARDPPAAPRRRVRRGGPRADRHRGHRRIRGNDRGRGEGLTWGRRTGANS